MGHRLSITGYPAIAIAVLAVLLTGCGGSQPAAVDAEQPPSIETLQELLQAELARLNADPAKTAAHAPSGADNAVFFLRVDAHGGSVPAPTEVSITWVEQLVGDYSQDGLVGVSDLTPIAQHWEEQVTYADPELHGGIEYWPSGDPFAGGAQNWRLARIDGNHDGLIGLGDITTIAQHWQERLSGYRVCRWSGEESTELAEVPRPQPAPGEPVIYSFDYTPDELVSWQSIEFFVESLSAADGATGPQSQMVAGGAGEAAWAAALELVVDGANVEIPVGAVCDAAGNLCVAFELDFGS